MSLMNITVAIRMVQTNKACSLIELGGLYIYGVFSFLLQKSLLHRLVYIAKLSEELHDKRDLGGKCVNLSNSSFRMDDYINCLLVFQASH